MLQPIKLGIVGLGRAGWGMHNRELQEKKDLFQIVAACDLIPQRVEKAVEAYGCTGYSDIDALIADPNVELVDIATRTCDHYPHAKKALLAGKHVLLEKPMCMNEAQATELFSLANAPGKPRLFIRQNRRFEEFFCAIRKAVESGVLGTVFEVNITQLGYQRRDDWQTLQEFGGGQLLNWGPHLIDHALMLLGAPVRQQHGYRVHAAAGGDCEDHFHLQMIGKNSRTVNVTISGSCALYQGRRFLIHGNRGSLEYSGGLLRLKYIDPEQVFPPVVSSRETPGAAFGSSGTYESADKPRWIETESQVGEGDLTVIWNHIYESLRNGVPYPIRDEEVLSQMRVITHLKEEAPLMDRTAHRDAL